MTCIHDPNAPLTDATRRRIELADDTAGRTTAARLLRHVVLLHLINDGTGRADDHPVSMEYDASLDWLLTKPKLTTADEAMAALEVLAADSWSGLDGMVHHLALSAQGHPVQGCTAGCRRVDRRRHRLAGSLQPVDRGDAAY